VWQRNDGDDLVLSIAARPGAKHSAFAGEHDGALRVDVAAPPVDGKANESLVAFLAAQFGVRRNAVIIEAGGASRRKRVRIVGPTRDPFAAERS
jgi:uncharacterized protein